MRKRIQCRVVKSSPLNRANRTFQDVSTSNTEYSETSDSFAVGMRAGVAGYPQRRGVMSVSASGIEACYNLDCYI
ncbi:MAG: hypothetical protein ACYTEQ_00380 [Planctomycetota bacterium]|jgi:hypothetical protein